jgi:hypothetical protein
MPDPARTDQYALPGNRERHTEKVRERGGVGERAIQRQREGQ